MIGNIDPVRVILDGSPGTVQERTLELRKAMKGNPNFILSTGCDLPPTHRLKIFLPSWKQEEQVFDKTTSLQQGGPVSSGPPCF